MAKKALPGPRQIWRQPGLRFFSTELLIDLGYRYRCFRYVLFTDILDPFCILT